MEKTPPKTEGPKKHLAESSPTEIYLMDMSTVLPLIEGDAKMAEVFSNLVGGKKLLFTTINVFSAALWNARKIKPFALDAFLKHVQIEALTNKGNGDLYTLKIECVSITARQKPVQTKTKE